MLGKKPAQYVVETSVPLEGVIKLKALTNWLFCGINDHEICITFANVNAKVKWLHRDCLLFGKMVARNHQPCKSAVSSTKLIPDLNLAEGRNSGTGSEPKK